MNSITVMSDLELVKFYKYCLVRRFYEYRNKGVSYHPNYRHCAVYIGENTLYKLHFHHEMYLLEQMWDRYINGNFLSQCWWRAQNIFQTKISYGSIIHKNSENNVSSSSIVNKKNKEILEFGGEKFQYLASGTKRKTYLSPCKTYVIKIPLEPKELGLLENKTESQIYKDNPNSFYAKCELIENDWLKMEYVQPKYFSKDDDYPEWTLSIAEHQVGYTLDGRLVAYDYGSKI